MADQPTIVLHLEALPCSVPLPIRLRQALKTLLCRDGPGVTQDIIIQKVRRGLRGYGPRSPAVTAGFFREKGAPTLCLWKPEMASR
jgi:hypothetical protein